MHQQTSKTAKLNVQCMVLWKHWKQVDMQYAGYASKPDHYTNASFTFKFNGVPQHCTHLLFCYLGIWSDSTHPKSANIVMLF